MDKIIIRTLIIAVAMFVATISVYGQGNDQFQRDVKATEDALREMGSSEARQAERNSTGIHRDASPEFKERAMESARREDANRTQMENLGRSSGSGSNSSSNTGTSSGGSSNNDNRDYRSNYGGSYGGNNYIPTRYTPALPKYEHNGKYYNTVAERDAAKKEYEKIEAEKKRKAEEERIRKEREDKINKHYKDAGTTKTIYPTSDEKDEFVVHEIYVNEGIYSELKPVEIVSDKSDIFLTISNKPIEITEDYNNINVVQETLNAVSDGVDVITSGIMVHGIVAGNYRDLQNITDLEFRLKITNNGKFIGTAWNPYIRGNQYYSVFKVGKHLGSFGTVISLGAYGFNMYDYQKKYGYSLDFWINATYSTIGTISPIPFTEEILRGSAEYEANKMRKYIENRDNYLFPPMGPGKW